MKIIKRKATNRLLKLKKILDLLKDDPQKSYKELCAALNCNEGVLQYTLDIGKSVGCLDVEKVRMDDGRFSYSIKNVIAELELIQDERVCIYCAESFIKGAKSKYKDICIKCTEKRFMQRKEVECYQCKQMVDKRTALKKYSNKLFFHPHCLPLFIEELNDKKKKEFHCKICDKKLFRKKTICTECKYKNGLKCKYCEKPVGSADNVCTSEKCFLKHCVEKDIFKHGQIYATVKVKLMNKIFGIGCMVCGFDEVIDYHHVIERKNGGENRLTNILPLCPNHHMMHHRNNFDLSPYIKKRDEKLQSIKDIHIDKFENDVTEKATNRKKYNNVCVFEFKPDESISKDSSLFTKKESYVIEYFEGKERQGLIDCFIEISKNLKINFIELCNSTKLKEVDVYNNVYILQQIGFIKYDKSFNGFEHVFENIEINKDACFRIIRKERIKDGK